MVKGGAPGHANTFGWMSQFSSLIGCLAFILCVVIGFWSVLALIFGLPSPQDSFGVRRVMNCTNYVAPGQNTVNCGRIWRPDERRENNNNLDPRNTQRRFGENWRNPPAGA